MEVDRERVASAHGKMQSVKTGAVYFSILSSFSN